MAIKPIKSYAKVIQCRKFNCMFHEFSDVGCRLRKIDIDGNGKCYHFKEKEPRINVENSINIDRKYIHDKIIPEIIKALKEFNLKKEKVNA